MQKYYFFKVIAICFYKTCGGLNLSMNCCICFGVSFAVVLVV